MLRDTVMKSMHGLQVIFSILCIYLFNAIHDMHWSIDKGALVQIRFMKIDSFSFITKHFVLVNLKADINLKNKAWGPIFVQAQAY